MTNVKTEVSKDGILTITVDLKEEHGPSASGKTIIVATSSGNQSVQHAGQEIKFGLNVYKAKK